MTRESMSLERLAVILDAYGADEERWPPEERAAALALIEASPRARAMLARAAELDRLLDAAPAVEPPSSALRQAILRTAPRAPAAAPRRLGWRAAAAFALAASLVLGMVTGRIMPVNDPADGSLDVLSLALLDDDRVGY